MEVAVHTVMYTVNCEHKQNMIWIQNVICAPFAGIVSKETLPTAHTEVCLQVLGSTTVYVYDKVSSVGQATRKV